MTFKIFSKKFLVFPWDFYVYKINNEGLKIRIIQVDVLADLLISAECRGLRPIFFTEILRRVMIY